jgi:hypothetical protein
VKGRRNGGKRGGSKREIGLFANLRLDSLKVWRCARRVRGMIRELELRRRWSGEVGFIGFYRGQMREMERRRARVGYEWIL